MTAEQKEMASRLAHIRHTIAAIQWEIDGREQQSMGTIEPPNIQGKIADLGFVRKHLDEVYDFLTNAKEPANG